MTTLTIAKIIELDAMELVKRAEARGVVLRITGGHLTESVPNGTHRHVVQAWSSRLGTALEPVGRVSGAVMSDREWAAMPANLREGCTAHVNGVGDI